MFRLSPNYRQDELQALPADIHRHLATAYWQKLPHRDTPHPKLLVVFSGGNAMGKSTLAQRISQELQAIVLENDAVKRCIKQIRPDAPRDELNRLTWLYTMDLYQRLSQLTANGLVVRDGVIDWYYDRILPVFKKQGYRLFIIAYDVSDELRRQQIIQRGDQPTVSVERLLELMADHDIHIARFRQAFTPDIILTDKTLFDHGSVIEKLQKQLQN